MKNEENIGLNDKKSSKDQCTTFCYCDNLLSILNWSSLFYSLSLILLSFLGALLAECVILAIWMKDAKEKKKVQEDSGINNYIGFCFQVWNCMYDFLASFDMHRICMWFIGYDMSLAWRIAWIDSGFSYPSISWITMVLWVLSSSFFMVGAHVPLVVGWVTSSLSLGWKNALEAV